MGKELTHQPPDQTVTEALHNLSEQYVSTVTERHDQMTKWVESYIDNGILTDEHRVPELTSFTERAVALAASYELMDDMGWEPEIVFVPKGLSVRQWDALLTGHVIGEDDMKTYDEGYAATRLVPYAADNSSSRYRISPVLGNVFDPSESQDDTSWDLAIIAGTAEPTLTEISPDGSHGPNAKTALKELLHFMYKTNRPIPESASELVSKLSPTFETMQALQLSRLQRSEEPVDKGTLWSFARERSNTILGEIPLIFQWYANKGYRGVLIDGSDDIRVCKVEGLRPAVSGNELLATFSNETVRQLGTRAVQPVPDQHNRLTPS